MFGSKGTKIRLYMTTEYEITYVFAETCSFLLAPCGYTGRFIMLSVITNIYNRKTKGPTLMELFTATGKLKKSFLTTMLTRVWQELEYLIDVCRVTRGARIEHF
jgi:hypothetical protein